MVFKEIDKIRRIKRTEKTERNKTGGKRRHLRKY